MVFTENNKYKRIFEIFEEITKIPHGSGNMEKISQHLVDFAKKNNLKYVLDDAKNVVIYKNATKGYEDSEPIILQGHIDMVCQKIPDSQIDFLIDGLEILKDGDFIKANGTTLGADNGIAVAIVMAILESDNLEHPPIEAVFTTDEEIGMLGAARLDTTLLSAKRMINLDSEEDDTVTVSCAGGIDFCAKLPLCHKTEKGTRVELVLSGLYGGHSGVEIHKNRVNADTLLGRVLLSLSDKLDFWLISVFGGDKSNAIPNYSKCEVCVEDGEQFKVLAEKILYEIKNEIAAKEPNFSFEIEICEDGEFSCIDANAKQEVLFVLANTPCGITEMSAEIEGLVETSLNLGVLETQKDSVFFKYALRSNKETALRFLTRRLESFFGATSAKTETSGFYPPWELNSNSKLQIIYSEVYKELLGKEPKIEAIHAGLECAVFSHNIEGIDCIAVGPTMFDVHTVNERLSISSTERIYDLVTEVLKRS